MSWRRIHPERSQHFTTRLGQNGRVTLPAALLPWKPGTRLYWTCRLHPSSGGKAVFASPHPLGSLHKGRYISSRVKVAGSYCYRAVLWQRKHNRKFTPMASPQVRVKRRLT